MQWPLVTCNPWRHPLQLSVFAACSLSAKQKGLGLLTALCRGRCGAFQKTATIPPFKAVWEQCALYGPWEKCRLLPSCDVATELCAAVYQTFTAAPFNDLICMFTYIVWTATSNGFAKQCFGRSEQCQMESRNAWQNSLGQKQQMWRSRNYSKCCKETEQGAVGRQRQPEQTREAWDGCSCLAEENPPVSFVQIVISFSNSWLF